MMFKMGDGMILPAVIVPEGARGNRALVTCFRKCRPIILPLIAFAGSRA